MSLPSYDTTLFSLYGFPLLICIFVYYVYHNWTISFRRTQISSSTVPCYPAQDLALGHLIDTQINE